MASGQFGRAADVLTQRFNAVQDGDWKRASHLDAFPDSNRFLTGRDEQELITS